MVDIPWIINASVADVEALKENVHVMSLHAIKLEERIEAIEEKVGGLQKEEAAPVAMEGYLLGMRDEFENTCWRLVDVGYDDAWACIKERGHDDGEHEVMGSTR